MFHTIVTLKKGEGRGIKSGGLWIFDNEIESIAGSFKNGSIVTVHDFDGYPMGQGFINQNSKIRVRLLTRHTDREIDEDFLRERVRAAWNYRKAVMGGEDLNCCRVIFGEADFLPGLVVDKYSDVLVAESLALGMETEFADGKSLKEEILEILVELLAEDGIRVRGIYERSDAPVRKKEGLAPYKGFIGEPFTTDVEIVENCLFTKTISGMTTILFPVPSVIISSFSTIPSPYFVCLFKLGIFRRTPVEMQASFLTDMLESEYHRQVSLSSEFFHIKLITKSLASFQILSGHSSLNCAFLALMSSIFAWSHSITPVVTVRASSSI
jgi:hypothetical protein